MRIGTNLLLSMRVEDVVSIEVWEVQQALLLAVMMGSSSPIVPSTICSPGVFCCHVISLYLLAVTRKVLQVKQSLLF